MPNPKRKHSHARTASRRTHYTSELPELQPNKQVGGEAFHLRHHATPDGYYRGRRVSGYKDKT